MAKTSEKKIKSGIKWNIISFGLTAILGVFTNIFISFWGSASYLGIYNILASYYIVLGQMASLGMQYAAVYLVVGATKEDEPIVNCSLLCISFISSFVVALISFIFAPFVGEFIYKDIIFSSGMRAVAVALLFFGVNKTIMGILNAYQKMGCYAILQTLRYLLILGIIIFSIIMNSFEVIGIMCFAIAEFTILFVGIAMIIKTTELTRPNLNILKCCLEYGVKSMVGGIINELNTKVDIMVLGVLAQPFVVGI